MCLYRTCSRPSQQPMTDIRRKEISGSREPRPRRAADSRWRSHDTQVAFAATLLLLGVFTTSCSATKARPLLEPPNTSQLYRAIGCDAHVIVPWRTLEGRDFRGRVVLQTTDQPIPGAVVAVRRYRTEQILRTEADEQGRFAIVDLDDGVYEFVACASAGLDPDMG